MTLVRRVVDVALFYSLATGSLFSPVSFALCIILGSHAFWKRSEAGCPGNQVFEELVMLSLEKYISKEKALSILYDGYEEATGTLYVYGRFYLMKEKMVSFY